LLFVFCYLSYNTHNQLSCFCIKVWGQQVLKILRDLICILSQSSCSGFQKSLVMTLHEEYVHPREKISTLNSVMGWIMYLSSISTLHFVTLKICTERNEHIWSFMATDDFWETGGDIIFYFKRFCFWKLVLFMNKWNLYCLTMLKREIWILKLL
jgi:hypothetical protein